MNLNVSVLGFFTFAFYMMIFGFLWRFIEAKLHDTPLGKAMLYIHG